ncbi:SatD family protein [Haliea sp. E1-2-M8]|uniref:SatD family protein n=1 Tax=Haliea sp. E1-2-M8 TaxID=3064706 RepID=UPI0027215C62|nr:SatD family protein [Haliea sp. E1-2-M8]MDO8862444.1 SatD family protein [Haliea sp. E1-2-M8]
MNYLALIGDICSSREVLERGELQTKLEVVLTELNLRNKKALASPLTITLGDEFQAVLTTATPLWAMVATIQSRLFPTKVRFGVGLGRIDTPINRKAALGMDGPAFHRARDAIDVLKQHGGLYRVEGLPQGELTNHSLALVSHLQEQWQHNRLEVYRLHLAGHPVRDIANELEISKSAVYKNIADGLLGTLADISSAISTCLDDALRGNHGN